MNNNEPARRRQKHYRSRLSRRMLAKYLLALIAWPLGFTALGLLGWTVCNLYTWQPGDPLYILLSLVKDFLPLVYGVGILGGWIAISYYFISKPLRYLDEIVDGAKQLVLPGDDLISLPADLKNIEDDMNLAKQQAMRSAQAAREAEQRKNDLIVYLAHDLKTPLTSVIGYLTLLRDEPQLSGEMRARYTGIALDKAERLEELINEFFDITRFNLTHLELETSPTDLALMLRQVASEFEPILAEKELTCRLELPEKLEYSCDAAKLARVFDNLLRNAANYSYPGGEVRISAKADPGGPVLAFTNTGRTIPPEKLARIFEQFFRLDSARQSRTGGAGLGLAIAKQIVELHGGTIAAASANDTVTFTVTLPARP